MDEERIPHPVIEEGPLAGAARAWLERRGWDWDEEVDDDGLVMAVAGHAVGGVWRWYLQVREPHHQVAMFSILGREITPDRRAAMAEFVLRASFGLTVGGFELDLDDGLLRFHTSVGFGGARPDSTLLGALLDEMARTNLSMTEGYWPAISAVLDGQEAPAAVRRVED